MSSDKIKTTIKALLAKAQGTEHEAEAAAFLAKATELLEKYQLDLGDLIDADDPVDRTIGATRGWVASWEIILEAKIAVLYGCQVIQNKGAQFKNDKWRATVRLDFIGRESARMTTELMFPYIKQQVLDAGKALHKEFPHRTAAQHARHVGNALVLRVQGLILAQREAESGPRTAAVANALVAVDRIAALVAELYPDRRTGRATKIGLSHAAKKAADGIGLHRQTGGATNLQIGEK